ncbi:serine protease [Sphingomonas sp. ID1715]|uniref:S1C family serine protease n=1 Tax=Sphingomonas sp. ID1715 TaxID=1656898 RepID=UPI001489128B|nr:S1C family serine protease [Sphingomonas sp. ID1715]NNM77729.1 serine protease [Sphingomonas sp. ID1715]
MSDGTGPDWRKTALLGGGLIGVVGLSLLGGYFGAQFGRPNGTLAKDRLPSVIRIIPQRTDPASDADLVEAACPSIVGLTDDTAGGNATSAAGFIVSRDGSVLTTAQAIQGDTATVLTSDGRRFPAKRIGDAPLAGIALFRIDQQDLNPFDLTAADFPRVGSRGLIAWAPAGSGCAVVPTMIGSDYLTSGEGGLAASLSSAVPLDPQLAGAPVLDSGGKVMGMVGVPTTAGEAPAIVPATTLAPIVAELLRSELPDANPFGLIIGEVTPALAKRLGFGRDGGAILTMLSDKGPAAKAGLQAGDIILSINDTPIASVSEAGRALATGGSAAIQVQRLGQRLTFTLHAKPVQTGGSS